MKRRRDLMVTLALGLLLGFSTVAGAQSAQSGQSDKSKTGTSDNQWVFSTHKWLGIMAENYDPEKAKQDQAGGTRRGVKVRNVVGNSPAERAGLKSGDVIVDVDGQPIESTRALREKLQQIDYGKPSSISVIRNGSPLQLNFTLEKGPDRAFVYTWPDSNVRVFGWRDQERALERYKRALERAEEQARRGSERALRKQEEALRALEGAQDVFSRAGEGLGALGDCFVFSRGRLGVETQTLNEQLGEYFGVEKGHGVLITSVRENSAAAKAGLKAGDVVVEVNGVAVNNGSELRKELNKVESGEVRLTVIRNRQRIELRPILEQRPAPFKAFELLAPNPVGQVYTVPAIPAIPAVPAVPNFVVPEITEPNLEIPEFEPCDFDILEFIS